MKPNLREPSRREPCGLARRHHNGEDADAKTTEIYTHVAKGLGAMGLRSLLDRLAGALERLDPAIRTNRMICGWNSTDDAAAHGRIGKSRKPSLQAS